MKEPAKELQAEADRRAHMHACTQLHACLPACPHTPPERRRSHTLPRALAALPPLTPPHRLASEAEAQRSHAMDIQRRIQGLRSGRPMQVRARACAGEGGEGGRAPHADARARMCRGGGGGAGAPCRRMWRRCIAHCHCRPLLRASLAPSCPAGLPPAHPPPAEALPPHPHPPLTPPLFARAGGCAGGGRGAPQARRGGRPGQAGAPRPPPMRSALALLPFATSLPSSSPHPRPHPPTHTHPPSHTHTHPSGGGGGAGRPAQAAHTNSLTHTSPPFLTLAPPPPPHTHPHTPIRWRGRSRTPTASSRRASG